jgi:hypothetical protein
MLRTEFTLQLVKCEIEDAFKITYDLGGKTKNSDKTILFEMMLQMSLY